MWNAPKSTKHPLSIKFARWEIFMFVFSSFSSRSCLQKLARLYIFCLLYFSFEVIITNYFPNITKYFQNSARVDETNTQATHIWEKNTINKKWFHTVAVLKTAGSGSENIFGALVWIFVNQSYSASCLSSNLNTSMLYPVSSYLQLCPLKTIYLHTNGSLLNRH